MLCYDHRKIWDSSWFFDQNMTFAYPKKCMCGDLRMTAGVVSSRDSMSRPSGSDTNECNTRLCWFWRSCYDLCELGLFLSITYYRSKRFFSIFQTFDVDLKWFDLWKHFRNVACLIHSWKFQRIDYYTAWLNSLKFVEKRDLPNHGQTCGHRFADVIWRIPNPTSQVFF